MQISPDDENVGTPSGLDALRHLASSSMPGSADTMSDRTLSTVSVRQSLLMFASLATAETRTDRRTAGSLDEASSLSQS